MARLAEVASAGNAAGFCVQYQDRPLERGKKASPVQQREAGRWHGIGICSTRPG